MKTAEEWMRDVREPNGELKFDDEELADLVKAIQRDALQGAIDVCSESDWTDSIAISKLLRRIP